MDLTEPSFLRLVDRIYAAAEDPRNWRPLYEELQQAVGVASIHMLGMDKRHGTLSYSDGANLQVSGELAYMQRYRHLDPRVPIVMATAPGHWTHCHEVLDEAFVARDPYYQEFLLPHDRRYMSATKLVDSPEAVVIFSTLRTAAEGPLAGPALAFLDRLLPHLQRACRIGLQNFFYSSQALVGQMLVNKLRQPVVLMTPGGEVIHTNDAARDLLRSTRLVALEGGKLHLPAGHLADMLQQCADMEQAVKAAQADNRPAGTTAATATPFRSVLVAAPGQGSRDSLYAFFTMLAPQDMLGTFGLRPVVMVLFYHPASAPAIDAGLLYAVFGLTPAECRVATLLAEGLSLKEIAEAQGTRHDTVRKQLQAIYQKTATNRQPDLVRLLLHLPHNAVQN